MAVRIAAVAIAAVAVAALVVFAVGMNVAAGRLHAEQRELARNRAQLEALVNQQHVNYLCANWMVSLANAAAQAFVVGDAPSRAQYLTIAAHAPAACDASD